ncbi:FtsK/SpoIIIE domain-containing protein [Protaetiibacter larvae]|uniref:FtsK domain-containing protein n=1 Tax=Protaetiibacter larvae TaxID=2592654 RepID=A0A5C1YAV2_9MICO|nr:FtsK/SpoIIIE domain-containing protein [Protaetiibacter larvae]QEO10349.1 hypothetical protein FLP23_10235 [Protaetiibacter larvae]
MPSDTERIALPVLAAPPPPPPFPFLAVIAPVVLAVVMWAITSSPYALAFAALGPVVAVAGVVDGRRSARRLRRRSIAEAARGLAAVAAEVDARLELRRRRLETSAAQARGSGASLLLGTADAPSGLELLGSGLDAVAELAGTLERLRARAATIPGAPFLARDVPELAVEGPAPLVAAFCRALVLQAAASCDPRTGWLRAPAGERWAEALPLRVMHAAGWEVGDGERSVLRIVVGGSVGSSPARPRVRLDDSAGSHATIEGVPDALLAGPVAFIPALVSAAEAEHRARELARSAAHAEQDPAAALPERVELSALLADDPPADVAPSALRAVIGQDADGPVAIDLALEGPHALVAGTTGSGKSELLVSWVLALAAGRSPREVVFLLVDFKGGASFAPLAGLPHVVGVVSDLDPSGATRAVASLRAELHRRERVLALHGARAIEELAPGTLPRLVVVVDEFAALAALDPELATVFSDLAARGRSLGLHLVLCTQRPSGVIRDAVLANVTLRVCLRVLDRADSVAVTGGDRAAAIPAAARGRAVLLGSGETREVQFAIASAADIRAVGEHWPGKPDDEARPWRDPLPALVEPASLPRGRRGAVIGLVDLPAEQRRDGLELELWAAGALLVVGSAGSGRTATLVALARTVDAEVRWVPDDAAELWQAIRTPGAGRVLVVADDLDRTLAAADPEQRADLVEALVNALRDTRRSGIALAASTRTTGGVLHGVAGGFEQRLLLRMPNREEHLLAGGEAAGFQAARRPGSAVWHGHEAQLAWWGTEPPASWRAPLPEVELAHGAWAIVTPRPAAWVARLTAAGLRVAALESALACGADAAPLLVGDVDAWLGDYARLGAVRREGRMLFLDCTGADHRALTRGRAALPPLGRDGLEGWALEEGVTRRVSIALD